MLPRVEAQAVEPWTLIPWVFFTKLGVRLCFLPLRANFKGLEQRQGCKWLEFEFPSSKWVISDRTWLLSQVWSLTRNRELTRRTYNKKNFDEKLNLPDEFPQRRKPFIVLGVGRDTVSRNVFVVNGNRGTSGIRLRHTRSWNAFHKSIDKSQNTLVMASFISTDCGRVVKNEDCAKMLTSNNVWWTINPSLWKVKFRP